MKFSTNIIALIACSLAATVVAAADPNGSGPAPGPMPPGAAANPIAAGPVSVKIDGPATAIAGEKLYLTLEETGAVRSRVWSVLPAGSVGFDARDGGSRADFATRFSGTYVFVVSVAGADGSVAHAFHCLELRDAAPAASAPQPLPAIAAPKPAADVPALILAWASQTPSPNRRAEAALIAGQLNSVAAAIDSGTNLSADPIVDARAASAAALGSRYAVWSPFFDQLGRLFADMRQRGALAGRESFSAALRNTANILERL